MSNVRQRQPKDWRTQWRKTAGLERRNAGCLPATDHAVPLPHSGCRHRLSAGKPIVAGSDRGTGMPVGDRGRILSIRGRAIRPGRRRCGLTGTRRADRRGHHDLGVRGEKRDAGKSEQDERRSPAGPGSSPGSLDLGKYGSIDDSHLPGTQASRFPLGLLSRASSPAGDAGGVNATPGRMTPAIRPYNPAIRSPSARPQRRSYAG